MEVEVLENKFYFRDGMKLAGPLNRERFHHSVVQIAEELQGSSVEVLITFLEYRKRKMGDSNIREIKGAHSLDALVPQAL